MCESETGQEVRDGLFDGQFTRNLAAVLLPFPVLIGIVAAIHFLPRRSRGDTDLPD